MKSFCWQFECVFMSHWMIRVCHRGTAKPMANSDRNSAEYARGSIDFHRSSVVIKKVFCCHGQSYRQQIGLVFNFSLKSVIVFPLFQSKVGFFNFLLKSRVKLFPKCYLIQRLWNSTVKVSAAVIPCFEHARVVWSFIHRKSNNFL